MRRVKKFKLNANDDIVLGDGKIIQTKGDIGARGDRGVPGPDGEEINEWPQYPAGLKGDRGDKGDRGLPGIDGEDCEYDPLSIRMGSHGSFADDDHPQYQKESEKDAVSGYAGLNPSSRTTKGVDTTDDVIIDLATKGLVLKDVADPAHYWRVQVSVLGVLAVTDLGTVKP